MTKRRAWLFARGGSTVILAVVASSSCGWVGGLDEYGASGARVQSAVIDGGSADPVNAVVPPTCPSEVAPAGAGVFVATDGSAGVECGSIDTPCQSVQRGIGRARQLGKAMVFVAPGTYVETVSLAEGVTVQGGWLVGAPWRRNCERSRAGSVTLQAPAENNVTVHAGAVGAGLDTLQILSKDAPAQPGESLYGIFAREKLTLVDVTVRVGKAGDGAPGASGTAGPDAATNTCRPAAGGVPAAPSASSFGAEGYVAAPGKEGDFGLPGAPSLRPPPSCSEGCVADCSQSTQCGMVTGSERVCATQPDIGCGGAPGMGGQGGSGGGSSVAVYAWGAVVTASGGGFFAMDGGNGGPGGAGGAGGKGGQGDKGHDAWCSNSCVAILGSCTPSPNIGVNGVGGTLLIGAPAQRGGSGGMGFAGLSGAGGSSFSIVEGGGAMVSATITELGFGKPGTSAGAMDGAVGRAGARGP